MKEVRVRVRVRSSKIEVRCESACGTIIEVRVCVRHTVNILATQHLLPIDFDGAKVYCQKIEIFNFDMYKRKQ